MKLATAITAAILLASGAAQASDDSATASDRTPVSDCESLPASASIVVFSTTDTRSVCTQTLRVLENLTVGDLQMFEKAAYLFSRSGYKSGDYAGITSELVDVIRLRGL